MCRIKRCRVFLLAVLVIAAARDASSEEAERVDVYTSGKDGYFGYRIPAIECLPNGRLLAFAEARKYNLSDPGWPDQDIDLVCKISEDGGRTWSEQILIEDPGEKWSAANPATIYDSVTGRLWLLYLRTKPGCSSRTSRPGTDDALTLVRYSDDGGRQWSEAIDLTPIARDMADPHWRISVVGPGGAVQLKKSSRLVAPVWKSEPYGVFTLYSDDHGKTWHRGTLVPGDHQGNENQLAELPDGRLLVDIRQEKGPHRWMALSANGGQGWSEPRPAIRVNPVACAIESVIVNRGTQQQHVLVWTGPRGPGRVDLLLRLSVDEGQTFAAEWPLYIGPAAYSDLTVLPDGSLGTLWERGTEHPYQFISFTRIPAANLAEKLP